MSHATRRAEARRQIDATETALANLWADIRAERLPPSDRRATLARTAAPIAVPIALSAVSLGMLWYALRRPAPALNEPHEQVLARWEDEGGNVLPEPDEIDTLRTEAGEALEVATARVAGLKSALAERGGEILSFARDQARKASADLPGLAETLTSGLDDRAQKLARQGSKAARRGVTHSRKLIRKHPIAATAAGFAAGALGGLLVALLVGGRSDRD